MLVRCGYSKCACNEEDGSRLYAAHYESNALHFNIKNLLMEILEVFEHFLLVLPSPL